MKYAEQNLMSEAEFNLIRDLINSEFGIILKGDKRLTLHTKVSHRLGILGLKSYGDYYEYIKGDSSREELFALASHITNNETYFFREKKQLDVFSCLLMDIKREKQRKNQNSLHVLSLACSSGEEPYTISIIIQESGLFVWDWNVRITGIDIDNSALARARAASYTKNSFRLNGNRDYVDKYFLAEGERYILRKSYSRNITFRHGNLLNEASYDNLSKADFVFCRNALIYMNDDAIVKITQNIYNCISDEGYLFIGAAESLIQKTDLFIPEYTNGIIVYRKNMRCHCEGQNPAAISRRDSSLRP